MLFATLALEKSKLDVKCLRRSRDGSGKCEMQQNLAKKAFHNRRRFLLLVPPHEEKVPVRNSPPAPPPPVHSLETLS